MTTFTDLPKRGLKRLLSSNSPASPTHHSRPASLSATPRQSSLLALLQTKTGGANRGRTDDLLRARQALSQLSYGPCKNWWAWVDSNHRPHPYQGCALTS